jgi:hypothetical protein
MNHKSRSGNPEFESSLPLNRAGVSKNSRRRRLKGGGRLESSSPHAKTTVELQKRLGAQWGRQRLDEWKKRNRVCLTAGLGLL